VWWTGQLYPEIHQFLTPSSSDLSPSHSTSAGEAEGADRATTARDTRRTDSFEGRVFMFG